MRQTLHIFKKDVRHLRYEIGLVLLMAAIFAFTGARSAMWLDEPAPNQSIPGGWIAYLLPLSWGFLIARVIHAEPLPGDRQFWFTRPYAWKSLLGAKALFIVAFVALPMLVADSIVIRAFGFSPRAELGGLLWNQFLITALLTLPIMAISSLTAGFVQLFGAVFVMVLAVFAWMFSFGTSFFWLNWIITYYALSVLAPAGLIIVIWQYASRKTIAARSLAAGVVIAVVFGIALIPWSAAYAIQSAFSKIKVDPSSIHVGMSKGGTSTRIEGDGRVRISIPIEITDVAEGLAARTDGLIATIEGPSGAVRRVEQWVWINAPGERPLLQTTVDGAFYAQIKNQPAKFRGTVFLTLFGNRRALRVAFEDRFVQVPGVGMCTARGAELQNHYVRCFSAFRTPRVEWAIHFLDFNDEEQRGDRARPLTTYDPLPADSSISPVNRYSFYAYSNPVNRKQLAGATVTTMEPLAHMRTDFQITNLRLGDFESPPYPGSRPPF